MTGTSAAAADFVRFMAAPENRAAWKHAGFEPSGD
jgi:ABC-type glycerol-3-phosphate transport system substrate-binding protein